MHHTELNTLSFTWYKRDILPAQFSLYFKGGRSRDTITLFYLMRVFGCDDRI